jgi:hypothetical protein
MQQRHLLSPSASAGIRDDAGLSQLWRWVADPANEKLVRCFFELYGLALQKPRRFPGFLEHVVDDWLEVLENELRSQGVSRKDSTLTATLVVAALRGLMLDLYTTGDRARVNRAWAEVIELWKNTAERPKLQNRGTGKGLSMR